MAEQRDLSVRAITVFGLAVIVTIVLVMFVAGGLTRLYRVPPAPPAQLSPEPRLQVNAPVALQQWRATEDALLYSNAIPIDRAMKLIVERGVK